MCVIQAEYGENYGADKFLEVCSEFDLYGETVQPWPIATVPGEDDK